MPSQLEMETEIRRLTTVENKYHWVMGLLRKSKMTHGKCQPRNQRACTACNATDDLNELIGHYKGATIKPMVLPASDTIDFKL